MDKQTLDVYEQQAQAIAARHRASTHDRLHQVLLEYFHPGQPTADIGSGSGRDLAWLVSKGFPAVGYEPSAAMRREATAVFPDLTLLDSSLPDLAGIADGSFDNVLSSAVLMHLPADSLRTAIANLVRILRPGGRLVVTFRTSNNETERENDGRLFTPIGFTQFADMLRAAGMRVLAREPNEQTPGQGVRWTLVVADKATS